MSKPKPYEVWEYIGPDYKFLMLILEELKNEYGIVYKTMTLTSKFDRYYEHYRYGHYRAGTFVNWSYFGNYKKCWKRCSG